MQLKYVHPNELKQVWNQIKPSLDEISKLGGDWIIEDAYCDLKVCKANLYVAIKNGYFIGYIITQHLGTALHIWAAYSISNNIIEEGMDEIKKLAHEAGVNQITFSSYRKGFEKIAPKVGFQPYTWMMQC